MNYRKTMLTAAILAGLSFPAFAQDAKQWTEAEIKAVVERIIKERPQMILDSLTAHEKSLQEEARNQALTVTKAVQDGSDKSYPILGNQDANPSAIVFLDYNCGYCRQTHPEINAFLKSNPDLSIAVVDLPVLGPNSELAARAALAAQQKGKYVELSDELFSATTPHDEASIVAAIQKVGLSVEELRPIIEDVKTSERILANRMLAQQLGITGTPAMLVGDELIVGKMSAVDMQERIEN